jgi:hypothetical protein
MKGTAGMSTSAALRRAGALALALLAAACGPIAYETGRPFEPLAVATVLHAGTSTKADVQRVLGAPFGRGVSMMPNQATPHDTWTYFFDHGAVDIGSGKGEDDMTYLFVFFDGDRMDSYLWFNAKVH